ncbi:MAG: hypothetical protein AABX34_01220 [Nanoarchaeota archaeon]
MKSRKSQVIGSVFVYLFSAVVIAMILIFGYKYIYSTKETFKQTELQLLKNDISSDIKAMSSDYGSSKKVSYALPQNAELCVFDLEKREKILNNEKMSLYPLINDSLGSNMKRNAFLISASIFEPLYVGEIEINEPYFYCFKTAAGKVGFVIEGKGNRTLILINS